MGGKDGGYVGGLLSVRLNWNGQKLKISNNISIIL